jgi:hypothetical protein
MKLKRVIFLVILTVVCQFTQKASAAELIGKRILL